MLWDKLYKSEMKQIEGFFSKAFLSLIIVKKLIGEKMSKYI